MNRIPLTLGLAMALSAGLARAQSPASNSVAQPTTPAPSVVNVAQSTNPNEPAVVQASAGSAAQPTATQIVYTPQLPSASDLTNAAASQGLTVERIVQTSNQVVAFYRNSNGQAMTVAYQALPPVGVTTAPSAATAPPVVVTAPPPTVVYETAPRVVYYDSPEYYYPRAYYPPVSFSFGYGFRSYHGGGGHYHRR